MKLVIATAGLMAGALLMPCVAGAQQQDSTAASQSSAAPATSSEHAHPVRNSDITTKIKSKLASHHLTSLGRIHVDTTGNGEVHLTGTARSQEAIDQAVEIAKGTAHVSSVTNDLKIKADD